MDTELTDKYEENRKNSAQLRKLRAQIGFPGKILGRKRDVSFPGTARQGRCGPRTETGRHAWDTFMTLAETTRKLNVSFYAYMRDRITGAGTFPPLAELVTQAATKLSLGQPCPAPSF